MHPYSHFITALEALPERYKLTDAIADSELIMVSYRCPVGLLREFRKAWKGLYNTESAAFATALNEFIEKRTK